MTSQTVTEYNETNEKGDRCDRVIGKTEVYFDYGKYEDHNKKNSRDDLYCFSPGEPKLVLHGEKTDHSRRDKGDPGN